MKGDENIRKEILVILQECMRDFDYGYSKEVGILNIRMVNRNKASYKLLEYIKKLNSEQNPERSVATEDAQRTEP